MVFELKYASTTKNVLNRIVDGLQQLARATSALNAKGVLVIVAADAASTQQTEEWEQQQKSLPPYINSHRLYMWVGILIFSKWTALSFWRELVRLSECLTNGLSAPAVTGWPSP